MNRDQRVQALGALGEQTVLKFFNYHGLQGSLSEDWYDDRKDMIVDGKTVEVKTFMPIFKYNAFCMPSKQGPKCDSVDRLIFVKVPHKPGDPIELYESLRDENGDRDFFTEIFNGQHCRFYRLTLLSKLGMIYDQEISKKMWDLSPSQFKGNDEYRARVCSGSK